MRYWPVAAVTTTCSPCKFGDVAVTATSATGALVEASTTLPMRTEVDCARALDAPSAVHSSTARRRLLRPTTLELFKHPSRSAKDLPEPESSRTVRGQVNRCYHNWFRRNARAKRAGTPVAPRWFR